jgi:hypothetical protein
MTKGLYQKGIGVKEFLDQKEEVAQEIVPFEYSDLVVFWHRFFLS